MDNLLLLVDVGGDLPAVGMEIEVGSEATGDHYALNVTAITGLRWNSKGQLIVEVEGRRRKLGFNLKRKAGNDGEA